MSISRSTAIASLCAMLLLAGCAGSAGSGGSTRARSDSAPTTEFFYGTMSTSSPDGKVPHGPPTTTLVRREITPGDDRIVETVVQNGVARTTTLSRGSGTTFTASVDDRSYDGTVTFAGEEWRWDSWTYALAMNDGAGTIEGTGRFDGKWIETEKYFVASNGERRTRITDRLVRIEQEEYDRRLAEMSAAPVKASGKQR